MEIISAQEAAGLVGDNAVVVIGGSGAGHAVPETLMAAIEERFLASGSPQGITSIHPVGLGNREQLGAGHFAHSGLLKRVVCGTLVDAPGIAELASRNEIEAYTLPQGVLSQLMREIAGGRPGLVSHVGLHTFVDPRHGGARQSPRSTEDLVHVITLAGREWLFYPSFDINIALLRGTTADENGNVSMEDEAVFGEMLSMAQAAKCCGGKVIVQVKRLARAGTLPARQVKIPGMLVDYVVVEPEQMQTFQTTYNPSYSGALRVPLSEFPELPLTPRKVVARRCALELFQGAVCNIGAGICTGIGLIAADEGVLDRITLTNEQGLIGGMPALGLEAGAAWNYDAIVDQPYQFDFYDGGGLDLAFLSFVEVDSCGNVNISRFKDRIVGIGGFVNISQNAKTVVFGGTFSAGGLEVAIQNGSMRIEREGRHRRFVGEIEQLTYNAGYAAERHQRTLYVTERAVFRAQPDGLELIEIAPGVDLKRDVLAQMDFAPRVAANLKLMDESLFSDEAMQLGDKLTERAAVPRNGVLAEVPVAR